MFFLALCRLVNLFSLYLQRRYQSLCKDILINLITFVLMKTYFITKAYLIYNKIRCAVHCSLAFSSMLKRVTLGDPITAIPDYAFSYCYRLRDMRVCQNLVFFYLFPYPATDACGGGEK